MRNRPSLLLSLAGALIALAAPDRCLAAVLNVPADHLTIQAAIDAAVDGDTIVVAPGIYRESLFWSAKNLDIAGAGAGQSIVDPSLFGGGPGGNCITVDGVPGTASISGFTFRNGSAVAGAGMAAFGSSLHVDGCAFMNNMAFDLGGGMHNGGGSPVVTNSLFQGNSAGLTGGGGLSNLFGSPTVVNCTFTGNTAFSFFFPAGAAIHSLSGAPAVANCILWGDFGTEVVDAGFGASVTFSDVQGGYPGAGNIDADPLFSNAGVGDLSLQAGSPCIDAGSDAAVPAVVVTDLAGNPRFAGAAVDMGALEFPVAAPDPSALIQDLKGAVDALVAGGAPLPAAGRSLQAKLDRALAALDAGDTAAAIESLQDFVNQVRAFVRTRRLSSAQGQALMDAATAILSLLAS